MDFSFRQLWLYYKQYVGEQIQPNLLFDSGISRPESPQATANPWKIKDDQGVSRRSSTLSQMPEVMVTNVSDKDKKAPIDEDRPKLSVTELMNLLPV